MPNKIDPLLLHQPTQSPDCIYIKPGSGQKAKSALYIVAASVVTAASAIISPPIGVAVGLITACIAGEQLKKNQGYAYSPAIFFGKPSAKTTCSDSSANLCQLDQLHLKAAQNACKKDIPVLAVTLKQLEQPVNNVAADRQMLAQSKGLKKTLLELCQVTKKELQEKLTDILNTSGNWKKIRNNVTDVLTQKMVPASTIKKHDCTLQDYQKNNGICSSSTTNAHATNLWEVSLKAGKQIFHYARHGIHSPYDLKDGTARKEIAIARAKESIFAAMPPELVKEALKKGSVKFTMASLSLVTPINLFGVKEGPQLADQMHAWEALSGKTVEIPVLQKGKAHTIKVDFTAITFNFPVNELAQSIPLLSWLPFINGHKTSDSYNAKAFHALIGDMKKDAPISGFAEKLLGQLNERDQKIVTTLIHDIRDIWHKKQHHSAGKDAYKLAIRVALLVLLLKIGLTFNCKSGKDRTGWLDTFIKYLLDSYASDQDPTESLKKIDKEKFSKIALNSGNDQIQRLNTGAPGNKCMKEIPFCTLPWSYFLTKEAYRQVKGLSFLVGS